MNQLISCCEGYTLVALKDTAFLLDVNSNSVCELMSNAIHTTKSDSTQAIEEVIRGDDNQKSDEELKMIHAIGVVKNGGVLFCAVAKGDKSLSIYKIRISGLQPSEEYPSLVYRTPKRLSCINFAEWPAADGKTQRERSVLLLAGDMAGDAYAYNLESKGQRLLLGHTASMLTGLCVINTLLLTADRDEKIRISSFPGTVRIEGFLLGHDAYITAVVATPNGTVFTASGDQTIRVWNLENQSQLFELSFASEDTGGSSTDLIPADMCLNEDASILAVVFDKSKRLDIYRINSQVEAKLELIQSVECAAQPLGVRSQGQDIFFVAESNPTFLAKYQLKHGKMVEEVPPLIQTLQKMATDRAITVPDAILERDPYGQIKLAKRHEARGPSADYQPWNRVERVETAREANRRHRKRRKEGLTGNN
jgi:hypothetical protein